MGAAEATSVDTEVVARRWLLIPLTRAVHLLIVHVRDPQSPIGAILREAAATVPKGVVEFYDARQGAAAIEASAVRRAT